MQRFLISGTGSGCGKTTVTCAILSALQRRGLRTASFKCGPDYIDPMFHSAVLGADAHNLDSFFCPPGTLRHLLRRYGSRAEISVLEGAMGFYDGGDGSACTVSLLTETPAVIVLDCKGRRESLGAVMQGFLHYRENRIAGFIFDRLPLSLEGLAQRLCAELGTQYFGFLPKHEAVFDSRHLGLVTAAELADLAERMEYLGALAEAHLRLDALLKLPVPPVPEGAAPRLSAVPGRPVIAVARDRAFCFHYAETLDLLREIGCELAFFSPLSDRQLPAADGLLLCGGYPELYARQLSENVSLREDIRRQILDGMPVIAECGGFLYLQESLEDSEGQRWPMAGVFTSEGFATGRLSRFGYVTLEGEDSLLLRRGEPLRAHEFHYWDSTDPGSGLTAVKPDGRTWRCCHVNETMYAGFPHLYLWSAPEAARRFAQACVNRRNDICTASAISSP